MRAIPPPILTAQDYSLNPAFGVITITSGFLPDPNWISLLAGGAEQSTYPDAGTGGDNCAGYFADAPDFRVFFDPQNTGYPLSFYVDSSADTVLLVNTPDGNWHCNDDSSNLNPALTFDTPLEGQYDIWVGTYSPTNGDYPQAELYITELEPFAGALERAFFGEDDRIVMDASQAPWNQIGYLDVANGSCTAALIGPATIVTAAHCIANGGQVDSPPVEFFAGFQQGQYVASSRTTGYHVPQQWLNGEQEGYDFAFVYLADSIGDQLGWMDVGPLDQSAIRALQSGQGPNLMQAGYSYDQDGVLTGNLNCPFIEIASNNRFIHQCDTLQGDSGSPIFVEGPNGHRILAVESHTLSRPSQDYDLNVAMYAGYVANELEMILNGTLTPPQSDGKPEDTK